MKRSEILLLALLAGPVVLAGCRSQAERTVYLSAFAENARLEQSPTVVNHPQVDGYLDGLGTMVLDAAREKDAIARAEDDATMVRAYDDFNVTCVHSISINAWTYGDDFTCVTTNLILQAESPEEVVAVLCHEFGHLQAEHLIDVEQRQIGHGIANGAIGLAGAAGDIAATLVGVPMPFTMTGLTSSVQTAHAESFEPNEPDDEYEADRYGLELYDWMQLDLVYFDDYYERSLAIAGDPRADSHPRTSERLARIRAQVAELAAARTEPPRELDDAAFIATKARLRQILFARYAAKELVSHESEVRARARAGYPAARCTACSPVNVEPEQLGRAFQRAMLASE